MLFTRFQDVVRRHGRRPAVAGEGRLLTYAELEAAALGIARALARACGAAMSRAAMPPAAVSRQPAVVGLLLEHGVDMIPAVLGALRTGAVYVPLDPRYPSSRLAFMVEHAGCDLILVTGATEARAEEVLRETTPRPACLRLEEPGRDDTPLPEPPAADAAAYILYTSGSTGRPKGVLQTQRNLQYFAEGWIACAGLGPADRVALVSSLGHDASIPDLFGSLLSGATLLPYDVRSGSGLAGIAAWLSAERVTMWHSVPTLYRRLAEHIPPGRQFPDLRWIVLGGEPVRESDLELTRRVFRAAELGVIYGQSESTIASVWRRGQDGPRLTLGTPFGTTRVVLADEEGAIVEGIGTGEVVVCSDHVAPGYWRDAAATEGAFTTDPAMGRLYWTGDLGRLAADGSITLTGRRDAQLKIRGHRVEPAEIETALVRHPSVAHAAVIGRPGPGGETELHAFVVPRAPVEPASLGALVSSQLPDYMIPRSFTMLDALPVLPTGKVDRAALAARPAPVEARPGGAAPRTETEAKVAALWKRLLGAEHVAADSDFFDLGGHSLAILELLAGVHDVFQTELSFKDALQYRTVEQFARLIDGTRGRRPLPVARAEEREAYPLSPAQQRLFLLAQDGYEAATFNMPAAVDVEGTLDRELLLEAVTRLVARHEPLRTSFALVRGEPAQIVHARAGCEIEEIRVAGDADAERAVRAFVRPFDLARAPLARVALLDRGRNRFTLLVDCPAIVCDSASREILLRDLVGLYAQQDLPPLTLQHRDHAVWQQRLLRSGTLEAQDRYWRARLGQEVPRLDLRTDFARPAAFSFSGARVAHVVSAEAAAFRTLAAASGATPFMAAVAAFTLVLHKRTGRDDVVVGGGVPGRGRSGLASAVGMFAGDLVLWTRPRAGLRFREHLEEVREVCVEALAHGDVPAERLLELLDLPRDPSRGALVDARVSMEDEPPRSIDPAGVALTRRPVPRSFTGCDLALLVSEEGSDLRLEIEYCADLFRAETMSVLARQVAGVIRLVSADPDVTIADIELSPDGATGAPRTAMPAGEPLVSTRSGERSLRTRWGSVRRAEARDYYPASALQQAIYRKHLAAPGKYNRDPIAYELRGPFDAERFQRALDRLTGRHALLRTSFHELDGRIVQRVRPHARCPVDVESCADAEVQERLHAFVRPFRLDEPPLCRVKLLRTGGDRWVVMFDVHHIVYDGESIRTFVRELAALYRGAERLPDPKVEYIDYAVWEERLVRLGLVDASLRYWRETLDGVRYARLPAAGPAKQGFGIEELPLEYEVEGAIARTCAALRCTRLGLLLSAFLRVLGRASGADDIAVGLRASTRTDAGLSHVVGPFLNKVVIRSRAGRHVPFEAFAGEVQAALLEAIEHAVCPYDMVRQAIAPHGGRADTFPVLVNYEAIAPGPRAVFGEAIEVRSLRLELPLTPDVVPYQLIFAVFDWPAGATLRVVYDRSCGTPGEMRGLLRGVAALLAGGHDEAAVGLTSVATAENPWTVIH